jgi:hypothetical protein
VTEAEFIELTFMAATVQSQYAMDFISIVFAYVVAGHIVGASLTWVQFVVLTTVYSAFTVGIGAGALDTLSMMASLNDRFLEQHPVEAAAMVPPFLCQAAVLPAIPFSSAWLISV